MTTNWDIKNQFLFGCDYNPDQWLDRPDILAQDLVLMKKAGVNVVSLGMFSWSTLEPEEDIFRFDWLDAVLDNLYNNGVDIFLSTPSGARPGWMAAKYPEVLRVGADGKRALFGGRHNHCFSSPVYRRKTAAVNRKLAERYASHPGVVLWHISNEYSGECHCDLCQNRFRGWLRERYGSLEALNKAWWNGFWSHTVTDWDQIHSPVPRGEMTVHGLNLDWKRFVTYMTVDFMRVEAAAVTEGVPRLPVTTNMMGSCNYPGKDPGIDYWKFRELVDIASWDSYPAWHMPGHNDYYLEHSSEPPDDYRRASAEAFHHDLFRCLGGGGPFLLMESTPSSVNWQLQSKIKKPGMIALSGIHAVSHGSNSVQYFQWRKSLGSYEKFHGAVVGHDGSADTRVFREVSALGSLLREMKSLAGSKYKPKAALLYNWENRWAYEDAKFVLNGRGKAYLETVKEHYYSLWDRGIPMDIISGDEDYKNPKKHKNDEGSAGLAAAAPSGTYPPYTPYASYTLISAPLLYMVLPGVAERLSAYVEAGGTLVLTCQSGYVNESDLCFQGGAPGPLRELLGLRVEEIDSLYSGEPVGVVFEGRLADIAVARDTAAGHDALKKGTSGFLGLFGAVTDYQDVIHVETAEVCARFTGGIADGLPAVTVNRYGKGEVWYFAGRFGVETLGPLYEYICSGADVSGYKTYVVCRDRNINIQKRYGPKEYLFVMNFSGSPGAVELTYPCREAALPAAAGSSRLNPPSGTDKSESAPGNNRSGGSPAAKRWELPPFGVKVLERVNAV